MHDALKMPSGPVSRAGVYEKLGKHDLAAADLRRAITLAPKSIFDLAARADAKKRVERIEKRIPCGTQSTAGANETCL